MNRRTLFFAAAAALLVSPDALCAPEPFNVRQLETAVFRQIYDGYAEQKRRKSPHWLRHSREYMPSDAEQMAFYHDVRAFLVSHFDAAGWPTEAPRICVLPPDKYITDYSDWLGGFGFIGCQPEGGEPRFWELRRAGWTAQDPAMFSVKPTA